MISEIKKNTDKNILINKDNSSNCIEYPTNVKFNSLIINELSKLKKI